MKHEIEISAGQKEDGVVIGNTYDKYGSKNPLVKNIMQGFHNSVDTLVNQASPKTIHEIGCGEGIMTMKWLQAGYQARGSDFSSKVIKIARKNALTYGLSSENFLTRSIYDLTPEQDSADLIICCEVLEHLDNPEEALEILKTVVSNHLILSVPREPLWRFLNLLRGKYILQLGNTPGHIQHWSKKKFINLVSKSFDIIDVKSPTPWTVLICRPKN